MPIWQKFVKFTGVLNDRTIVANYLAIHKKKKITPPGSHNRVCGPGVQGIHRHTDCLACKIVVFTAWLMLLFSSNVRAGSQINGKRVVCESGGFKLVGDLYAHKNKKKNSEIVFLHGSTIKGFGRNLLLYRYICKELYKKGYNVFAYDARGYGESEGPDQVETLKDVDFVGDVSNVITCILQKEELDPIDDITLVGHSFGGGVAISAGIKDPRVKRIISISPPRRIRERFFSNAPQSHGPQDEFEWIPPDGFKNEFEWIRRIKSEDMGLSHLIPRDLMKEMLETYDIENVVENTRFDKPVLLIDGSRESRADRKFLKRIYEKIRGPKAYVTIEGAEHFFGTFRGLRVESVSEMKKLVDTIDQFIKQN